MSALPPVLASQAGQATLEADDPLFLTVEEVLTLTKINSVCSVEPPVFATEAPWSPLP